MIPASYHGDNRRGCCMVLDIRMLQNSKVNVRGRSKAKACHELGIDGCTHGCVKMTFLEECVGRVGPGAKRTYLQAY